MRLTLVPDDNLCIIDEIAQVFDYSDLLTNIQYGDDLHATQWLEIIGQIELRIPVQDENDPNFGLQHIEIYNIDEYQPIIDRYESNKITIDYAIQSLLYIVNVTYLDDLSKEMSYDDAVANGIQFTLMTLDDAQFQKIQEARNDGIAITNDLFNKSDVLGQISSRTMMNQRWNSLNSKTDPLTPEEEAEIATFNDVHNYLNDIDAEFAVTETEIRALTTVDAVVHYSIEYNTEMPTSINDSNPAIQFLRRSRI